MQFKVSETCFVDGRFGVTCFIVGSHRQAVKKYSVHLLGCLLGVVF